MTAERIPQSKAIQVAFNAVLSSDHASPATGKTIALTISKIGGTFVNPSAGATNATEIASGSYVANLSASDTNTLGPLIVLGTASGVDNVFVFYDVVTLASQLAPAPAPLASPGTYSNFQTAVDVGNRALQHVGQEMMDFTLGFTEPSKNAQQVAFAYSKLRRTELRENLWSFATKRAILRAIDTNTMFLLPALWVANTIYFKGSIVSDQYNGLWISRIPDNLNNQPQNSTTWEPYFGPLSVSLYDASQSYSSGELVYTAAGDGTWRVYLSLQSGNADNPATATAWAATTTYMKDQVVTASAVAYLSLIDLNINQTPSASAAAWAAGTTYALNAKVNGSDNITYTSLAGGNVGNNPTTDAGVHWSAGGLTPWSSTFIGGTGSLKWLEIGGAEFPSGVALTPLNFTYPVGTGPSSQTATLNVFRLPAGFLRMCSQDPKAGSTSMFGAPTGLPYKDWLIENNLIVTRDTSPLLLRFVADVTDVSLMNDLFCEGLAARIGMEVCEPLTQSSAKVQIIKGLYERAISRAKTMNAIEIGSEEPPIDDWIACRA